MKATVHPFRIALREPLVTAAGTIGERQGFLVRVEDGAAVGWGEAAPIPGFPGGTLAEVEPALQRWSQQPDRPTQASLSTVPLAAAAVDTALVSLEAARAGHNLCEHLTGEDAPQAVPVNALVTESTPADAAASARQAVEEGFSTIKVKVGQAEPDAEIALVREVRAAAGDRVAVRLDANRAWTPAQAAAVLEGVSDLGIEYVEEPTADLDTWPALAELGVPLALDESMGHQGPDDSLALVRSGHVSTLVVKIPLLSGVRPALAAAGIAATRGASTVVTSFVDTAVGMAAAIHLAAALGPAAPAAGLATGALLERDVDEPAVVRGGCVAVPHGPGLGVEPDLDALG